MKIKLISLLVVALCFNLFGCSKQPADKQIPPRIITEEDKRNAVWLNREFAEDYYSAAKIIPDGKVVISDSLDEAMKEYPEDTVFGVAICFSSMVSERKLEDYSYNEKSDYLEEIYTLAKEGAEEIGVLVHYPSGTCEIYQFFYAFGTAEQFRSITCERGVSLYIAATYQYM